jgi:GTP cyclohydrolase I
MFAFRRFVDVHATRFAVRETLRPSPSRIVSSRIRPPNTAAVMKALRIFVVIRTTITISSATNIRPVPTVPSPRRPGDVG